MFLFPYFVHNGHCCANDMQNYKKTSIKANYFATHLPTPCYFAATATTPSPQANAQHQPTSARTTPDARTRNARSTHAQRPMPHANHATMGKRHHNVTNLRQALTNINKYKTRRMFLHRNLVCVHKRHYLCTCKNEKPWQMRLATSLQPWPTRQMDRCLFQKAKRFRITKG